GAGDRRGPAAAEHHGTRREVLARDLQRIEQRRHRDDRRAVLVVVEHRDAQALQAALDLEAARCRDVFEVDAAEDGRDGANDRYDLIYVLRRQTDRERIDAGELLEEHGLSFHHRDRRFGAQIAEPEDGRAVRDHGHRVALDRQLEHTLGSARDLQAYLSYARSVRQAQIVLAGERNLAADSELAVELLVQRHRLLIVVHHGWAGESGDSREAKQASPCAANLLWPRRDPRSSAARHVDDLRRGARHVPRRRYDGERRPHRAGRRYLAESHEPRR